ncbi:unnamed protein product [Eruca vesicaria subsp. sativa]|uniref:Uncharacterized protein n=1 Tax=Eruca vesicaria subsp. sativa TaxID=29727 RepID=A0ABC8J7M8_ERUVS|nr:unnamed protein product [Eruca vesicaria subsp. sativa]
MDANVLWKMRVSIHLSFPPDKEFNVARLNPTNQNESIEFICCSGKVTGMKPEKDGGTSLAPSVKEPSMMCLIIEVACNNANDVWVLRYEKSTTLATTSTSLIRKTTQTTASTKVKSMLLLHWMLAHRCLGSIA